MSSNWRLFLIGVTLFTFSVARAIADHSPDRIATLVRQLGDSKFAAREAAGKELAAIGEEALPAVRHAAVTTRDSEVRRRARHLDRTIMLGARKSKSIGMETALIDPGEFQMGSPTNESVRQIDETQHRVHITKPFLLGVHEVTQGEFRQVSGHNPSWFRDAGAGADKIPVKDTSRFPVERVTWFDAVEFCNLLSQKDGYEPFYKLVDAKREEGAILKAQVAVTGGNGYRLPTEAEWEFACRAGTISRYHFGSSNNGRQCNAKAVISTGYGEPSQTVELGRTAKVGSYNANAWGLFDMHGNVAEWCWDWYDSGYYGDSPKDDPKGPERGHHRILRGGSWMVSVGLCRSASRFWQTPDERKEYAGFRVARSP